MTPLASLLSQYRIELHVGILLIHASLSMLFHYLGQNFLFILTAWTLFWKGYHAAFSSVKHSHEGVTWLQDKKAFKRVLPEVSSWSQHHWRSGQAHAHYESCLFGAIGAQIYQSADPAVLCSLLQHSHQPCTMDVFLCCPELVPPWLLFADAALRAGK